MLKHLDRASRVKLKGLRVGGLITHIAKRVGGYHECPVIPGEYPKLDIEELGGRNRWVDGILGRGEQFRWFLHPKQWFMLPCPVLPSLDPPAEGPINYLIPPHLYFIELIDGSSAPLVPPRDEEMHDDASVSHQFVAPQLGQFSGFSTHEVGQGSSSFDQTGQPSYVPPDYTNPGFSYVNPPDYYGFHDQAWRDSRDNQFYAESRMHFGAQYQMGVRAGVLPTTGALPSYYTGPDGQAGYFPEHLLRQHGIDPATYDTNYHMRYGGWDGQFLGQPRGPPPPPPGDQ